MHNDNFYLWPYLLPLSVVGDRHSTFSTLTQPTSVMWQAIDIVAPVEHRFFLVTSLVVTHLSSGTRDKYVQHLQNYIHTYTNYNVVYGLIMAEWDFTSIAFPHMHLTCYMLLIVFTFPHCFSNIFSDLPNPFV